MLWQRLLTGSWILLASGCHVFGGVRLTEVATATGKPSNVASFVTVTQKGQPVADLGVAAFKIVENDQPLDSKAIDLRLLDPAMVAAFHTVLLLDLGHGTTEERKRQLSRAAAAFVRRMRHKQAVTVLAFDGAPRTRLVGEFPVETGGNGPEQLENLMLMAPIDPSRNLNGAVIAAIDALDGKLDRNTRPVRVGTVVIFSRGPDIAGRVAELEFESRLQHSNYQFVYVNVAGDPAGDRTLPLMNRGRVEAQAVETLPIALEDAAMLATRLSSQYYLLSYCSPARAGERRLRIEVELNNTDGAAESDAVETHFDATGFSPQCNAGVPPRFGSTLRSANERTPSASSVAAAAGGTNGATVTKPPVPSTAAPAEDPGQNTGTPAEAPTSPATLTEPENDVEVPPPRKPGYAP